MQCARCNAPLDDNATFCGNCGTQVAPLQAQGATVASSMEDTYTDKMRPGPVSYEQEVQPPVLQRPSPYAPTSAPIRPANTPAQGNITHPPVRGRPPLTNIARLRIIIALALIVIAGSTAVLLVRLSNNGTNTAVGANATGRIAFIDNPNGASGHTDALKISIQGLEAPPAGSQYDAWLVNSASEHVTALGSLTASGQTFVLSYAGDGRSSQAGTNLLGAGDKVEVTIEQGSANSPTGRVILSAAFPPKAFVHIKHLLFSFPITPGKIGLVVGLLDQAQLLNAQALILQTASANHDTSAIHCASQSIIDIIEGRQGSAYQRLPQSCIAKNISAAGDGFGMLGNNGYVELAKGHALLAATQTDSTDLIRLHAGHVEIAMTNIKGWLTTVEQDALALRAAPSNTGVIQEIATLSDHVYHGVDINSDESVDPVPGEAGAITAYNHAQLMATLQLVPGLVQ